MRTGKIGSPVERIEDLRFLRGRGKFVDDVACEGALHAVILRSSVAHGRIRGDRCQRGAGSDPACAPVITAADIGEQSAAHHLCGRSCMPEGERYQQPVIAHDKVRYVGEPIAVVVADSAALAEDALEAIGVDIERLPVVADRDAARRDDVLLFEEAGSNLATTLFSARTGRRRGCFHRGAYVRRERFTVQRYTAVPMEPRGLLAEWDEADEP